MKRKDAAGLLPIIIAFAEGQTIQVLDGGDWRDLENPKFTGQPDRYRIKPEPLKVWIIENEDGTLSSPWVTKPPSEWLGIKKIHGPFELKD